MPVSQTVQETGSADAVQQVSDEQRSLPAGTFTRDDLFRWGLDGMPGAARRRQEVGSRLGIGMASSKTFLRRLNHFGISREEVETALRDSK